MTHPDDELRALIDGSFGAGPTQPPLAPVLGAGHRAVRRRRTALVGAAAAAVLVVVAGTSVALSASDPGTRGLDPAGPTTGVPAPTPIFLDVRESERVRSNPPVRIEDGHTLVVRPGVEVADAVENPFKVAAPAWSLALDLRYRGARTWVLATDQGVSVHGPGEGTTGFDHWVVDNVALQSAPTATDPTRTEDLGDDLVRLQLDGELLLHEGVELRDRVDDPFGLDRAGLRSAVVDVLFEGRRRWIALQVYDRGSAVAGRFADEPGPTFAEFVAEQRRDFTAGASGGGR